MAADRGYFRGVIALKTQEIWPLGAFYLLEGWALGPAPTGGEDVETRAAIGCFLLDRESANLSKWTIDWYKRKLRRFCSRCPELPEEPVPIREFLASIQERMRPSTATSGLSDETKHGYFRAVRALYNFVQREWGFPLGSDDKRDDANPIRRLTAPRIKRKVMRSLSLDELHRLLNAPNGCRESKWHLRDEAIVTLIADTGIRLSEAVLTWDSLNGGTIYVDGKTGQREVPILPETRELLEKLRQWNQTQFGPSPYVFLGKQGPLTPQGVQEAVERTFKRAGLNGSRSSPHTLRHTFARNWVAEGGDPFSLQQILGHTTMTMVRRYVAMNTRELVKQHQRFSPVRAQARLSQGSLWGERLAA